MQGLPASAAWRHVEARAGVEVVFLAPTGDGLVVHGQSTAVEDGVAWGVRYAIALDATWTTRSARVAGRSAAGPRQVRVEGDGAGGWRVDGRPAPELAGCLDVDLEASAFTNAFPVHRLGLAVGARAEAPAAYVRAPGLQVERLEQRYARLADDGDLRRYEYAAPAFGFTAQLAYDRHGLVIDYPGIAVRLT